MDRTQDSLLRVPLQPDSSRLAPREQEDLVVRHLPVARSLAARYAGRGIEAEDLRQAARMGLVKAASRYEPSQGEFLSYAVPVARGEIRHCFRDLARSVRSQRLEDGEDPFAEQLGEPDPGFDRVEARVVVGEAIGSLGRTDRMILQLRFVDDLTQAEIGERIGATQAQVSRSLARIIRRMRVTVAA